jgi:STE24 endopeptidase
VHGYIARRAAYGLIVAAALVLVAFSSGVAAIERPNALDHRVDTLSPSELMTRPAVSLVDPARQAAAVRRVHWTLLGWILIQLFQAAALFYLWSSGSAAALRDWLARRIRSEWNVRFLFGAALALVARLAALLPSFYLYRVDRILQLTAELTRTWAAFWILHTLLGMIVAGLIAATVLWLVGRTHQWYVYTMLGVLAASVGWSYLSSYVQGPVTHEIRPLRAALDVPIRAMFSRAHLAPVPVLESLDSSPLAQVVVVGWGSSSRILLSHSLIAGDTEPEIEYQIAYELERVAHGDRLTVALIEGGVIIVFAAIAIVIADRIRFRRDDDSLSRLAIVGALLALVYLGAVPARNAALRSYDFDADRYAVAVTGDPSAAVRALVRASDQRMIEVCPEESATLFLYTAAGIGARVAAINHVPSGCSY